MKALASKEALDIAIVGHTNTGKTSLIRTLLQDSFFGAVSNRAGTTRHVEALSIDLGLSKSITFYDTPGMEDAIALLDTMNVDVHLREQSAELIEGFLASEDAHEDYAQEAKVFRQILKSDLAIYVIDAREPVLGKYRDELKLLSLCGKPILPLLNFTAQNNLEPEWRDALSSLNLHVVASFDTVLYNHDHEINLFEQIKILLHDKASLLSYLKNHRAEQWLQRSVQAKKILSTALIDFAAWRETYREDDVDAQRIKQYQEIIRNEESKILKQFLELYQFPESALDQTSLGLKDLHWIDDIFDVEVWVHYGLDVGSAVAKGGAVGFTLDVMTGGLSLGLGTMLGASAGLLLRKGREWKEKLQGYKVWQLSEQSLQILFARQQLLLSTLSSRGHASVDVATLEDYDFSNTTLPRGLKKARVKPYWSRLNDNYKASSVSREKVLQELIREL